MWNKYLQVFTRHIMIFVLLVTSASCSGKNLGRDSQGGEKINVSKVTPTVIPPTEEVLEPTPTPEPTEEVPEPLVILILGSDQLRPYASYRTDAIHLVVIHKDTKAVKTISIPRDLWVEIPGHEFGRINGVYGKGGFDLLAETMALNFGIEPEFYLMVDYWFFPTIVDQLGGIDVQVATRYCVKKVCAEMGNNHMDGATARAYAVDREKSDDIGRQVRQWEVILAIYRKLLSLKAISKAPELYQTYQNSITTNISLQDVLAHVPLALAVAGEDNIDHLAIGWLDVVSWQTSSGGEVLLPLDDRVEKKFNKLMEP